MQTIPIGGIIMIEILIAQDERPIASLIALNLTACGYHCRGPD